jgi:hypothetical protein
MKIDFTSIDQNIQKLKNIFYLNYEKNYFSIIYSYRAFHHSDSCLDVRIFKKLSDI